MTDKIASNIKTDITGSEGYQKLLASVERDEAKSSGAHDYRGKLAWVVERAKHYAEITSLHPTEIIDAWEGKRDYWYMNFYQDARQPLLTGSNVRVFDKTFDLLKAVGDHGFRCPACRGVSKSPYTCDSGVIRDGEACDWKSYGLFGTLGKGLNVFVKSAVAGENIFMPIALEADFPEKEAS